MLFNLEHFDMRRIFMSFIYDPFFSQYIIQGDQTELTITLKRKKNIVSSFLQIEQEINDFLVIYMASRNSKTVVYENFAICVSM